MRSSQGLIVVLVLAVLGGLAFYLVRSQPSPTPSAGPAVVSRETPAPAAPEAALSKPTEAAPQVPSGNVGAASERTVSEAPAAAPKATAAPAKSESVLAGRVVDAFGNPVAGAKVAAGRGEGFMAMSVDGDHGDHGGRAGRITATTADDGSFELSGLEPGVARLSVRKPGFAPYDRGGIGVPAQARHELEPIALEASVVLEGRVVDSRGRGVGGAKLLRANDSSSGVFLISPDGKRTRNALAESTEDGSFRIDQIASGAWSLLVVTEDHPDKKESGTTERPGETVRGLSFALDDGYEIAGRVTGAPDGALSSSYVRAGLARAADTGASFTFEGIDGLDFGVESREADVQRDGTFTVRGLREGQSYGLQVRKRGADFFVPASQSTSVTAAAGDRGVTLPFQPEGAIVFQVVDARTQQPITRYQVDSGIGWPMPLMDDNRRPLREHLDGRARVGNLRPKSTSDRAKLTIEAVGYEVYSRDDIAVALGRETDVGVIELEPTPVVQVTVLDAKTGAPVPGARVTLSEVEEDAPTGFRGARKVARTLRIEDEGGDVSIDDGQSRSAKTEDDGVATINSFEERPCRLRVVHKDHAPYQSEVFTPAKDAVVERTVRLSGGGSVKLTLLSAKGERVAGGRIDHRAPGASSFEGMPPGMGRNALVTNAEGELVVASLEPGVHRFKPHGSGGPGDGPMFIMREGGGEDPSWSEVEVAEGAQSELTLTAPMKVEVAGRVREAGEELSGARVSLRRKRAGEDEDDDLMPMMGGGPSAKSDGHGRYTIANVESGEYTLTVRHPSRSMASEFSLRVDDADVKFDIELPVSSLEGRITDQSGNPLAGIKVWAERKAEPAGGTRQRGVMVMFAAESDGEGMVYSGGPGMDGPRAKSDADGRYTLRGVQPDVPLEVHASGPKVQADKTDPVQVAADQTKSNVDLALAAAGTIEVKATRADGTAARMLLVRANFDGEGDAKSDSRGEILQSGKLTLDGLAPGKWRVSIESLGGPGQNTEPAAPEQTIEVKSGESVTATFSVP